MSSPITINHCILKAPYNLCAIGCKVFHFVRVWIWRYTYDQVKCLKKESVPFAGEFERAHFNCFPELGKIRVYGLKVRRKSCFYHLSELFPLKYAFQGAKGWFLHIAADHVQNQSGSAECLAIRSVLIFLDFGIKCSYCTSHESVVASKKNGLGQRPFMSKGRDLGFACGADGYLDSREEDLCTEKECSSETISETISVSGIISRYFSSFDEVNSNSRLSLMELQAKSREQMKAAVTSDCQDIQFSPLQVHCQLHPESNLRSSEDKPKTDVGLCLVEASRNLGLSASKKNLAFSLSKFVDARSKVTGSANTHVRRLIFEIPDEDD